MCDHWCMPTGKTLPGHFSSAVSEILREMLTADGRTIRELSDDTGITYGRVQGVMARKKAILVDELDAIARALGTKGSVILARAEDDLYGPVERSRPPFQLRDEDVEDELKAAKDAPYSPEAEYEQ